MVDVTNIQGQGSQTQGSTDDILSGEDIFAQTPEVETPEEDLSYGDLLEKKYQFEPIPEDNEIPSAPVVEPVVQEVAVEQQPEPTPAPVVPEVSEPVTKPVTPQIPQIQPAAPVVEPVIQEVVVEQQPEPTPEPVEVSWENTLQTDIQKKFSELFFTTKKIYELKEKLNISTESFDILGANNDKIFISYTFLIDETTDPTVFITKNEQNKETEEEVNNELKFILDTQRTSLQVMVNDTLLFDEAQDFAEDQKKKLQVVDKINKFMFLSSEEVRKLENVIKQKEEEERERKRLQEIFRNF